MCGGVKQMKILIVTVAGCSTRFRESLGKDVLKCLYYENDIKDSLLCRIIHQPVAFDKYIIVGGYQFKTLKETIERDYAEYHDRIVLVENTYFDVYGSGYSLYCGLKEALKYPYDEIVFAEGDLFFDTESFVKVFNSDNSVITCNADSICANKAVAFYFDEKKDIHYIYDTGHNSFCIKEPFLAIYNSAQIWKFTDKTLLEKVWQAMDDKDWHGTNLVMIENYFGKLDAKDYSIVKFKNWINCNTITDFENIGKAEQ
jgi:hypothetical protein